MNTKGPEGNTISNYSDPYITSFRPRCEPEYDDTVVHSGPVLLQKCLETVEGSAYETVPVHHPEHLLP